MKTKRFDKKLVFNKKTIAHLENRVMNVVQGGETDLLLELVSFFICLRRPGGTFFAKTRAFFLHLKSEEEVRLILCKIRIPVYRICMTMIYSCGLRLKEAVQLEFKVKISWLWK